jgi:hypothetical protein
LHNHKFEIPKKPKDELEKNIPSYNDGNDYDEDIAGTLANSDFAEQLHGYRHYNYWHNWDRNDVNATKGEENKDGKKDDKKDDKVDYMKQFRDTYQNHYGRNWE